jgi:TBC1 domain family protein 5
MPDEPYFRNYETQKMLLDILFIYCKINQDIGYRQGMHELLAPVLWVVQKDALTPLDLMESMSADDSRKPMMNMLNASFVEHDSFTLFSLMMRTAKSFYELSEPKKIHDDQQGSFPIVERSKRIHEVLLAQLDPELASHLTQIEILPQIFLM